MSAGHISIERVGEDYRVTVQGPNKTTHRVRVPEDYARGLTKGYASVDELIRRSFEFLLERKANTALGEAFSLPDIGRAYPEYETVLRHSFGEI